MMSYKEELEAILNQGSIDNFGMPYPQGFKYACGIQTTKAKHKIQHVELKW